MLKLVHGGETGLAQGFSVEGSGSRVLGFRITLTPNNLPFFRTYIKNS